MMQKVLAWEFDMAREPWGGKLCKGKSFDLSLAVFRNILLLNRASSDQSHNEGKELWKLKRDL